MKNSESPIKNRLLTSQVKPKNLKQLIIPNRIRQLLGDGEMKQNLLLYGSQGLGKTSTANILTEKYPTLYINISDDRGIDVVREKIIPFASTKSLDFEKNTDIKVVWLEEIDGANDFFFKALRATMENYGDSTRFIATCNYVNKIPKPLWSRFTMVNYDPVNKSEEQEVKAQIKKRVELICGKKGIQWANEQILIDFIDKKFPDIRKIISTIQQFEISGIKVVDEDSLFANMFTNKALYELLINKDVNPEDTYKLIMSEYTGLSDYVFMDLVNEFPDWIFEKADGNLISKLPELMISIADHDFKRKQMIDENLGLISLIFDCQLIIRRG